MTTLSKHSLHAATLIIISLLFAGCDSGSIDSTDVDTNDIYADISIKASRADRSDVNVELNLEGRDGRSIELSSNEKLEATLGGTTIVLEQDSGFSSIEYQGSFDNSSSADPFQITLFRKDGTIIDGSSVSLADEFLITSPTEDDVFDSDQTAVLQWTPERSGEMIELTVDTTCTLSDGGTSSDTDVFDLDDDGAENFLLSDLSASNNSNLNSEIDCSMDITLTREQTGVLDARFESGGQIIATQSRQIEEIVLRLQ